MWKGVYTYIKIVINLLYLSNSTHYQMMSLLWHKIHDPLEPLLAHSSHILCRNPIVNVVVIPKQVLKINKFNLALN